MGGFNSIVNGITGVVGLATWPATFGAVGGPYSKGWAYSLPTMKSGGGGGSNNSYGAAGDQYLQLLAAYQAGMPSEIAAQKEYSPQFTEQSLTDFNNALVGINGVPGYLSQYSDNILPATLKANTAERASNLADLAAMSPDAMAALRAINPQQTDLTDQLTKTATNQLRLGTQLDPEQVRQINNAVLGTWSNRGLGSSNPAQLDAAMQLLGGGQNLLQQRQTNAMSTAQMNQGFYTDPIMATLGITNNPTATNSLSNSTQSVSGQNPSQLGADQLTSILGGVYSGQNDLTIAQKNNKAALWAAAIGAAGSLGGGALAGAI
ncbi:MAG: hypothetical protein KGL39_22940 [Patescibacteria group bacterium]|nr:hypothetical protein [Patescibacteria group bacterium]